MKRRARHRLTVARVGDEQRLRYLPEIVGSNPLKYLVEQCSTGSESRSPRSWSRGSVPPPIVRPRRRPRSIRPALRATSFRAGRLTAAAGSESARAMEKVSALACAKPTFPRRGARPALAPRLAVAGETPASEAARPEPRAAVDRRRATPWAARVAQGELAAVPERATVQRMRLAAPAAHRMAMCVRGGNQPPAQPARRVERAATTAPRSARASS